jgi:hypothetical protein
VHIQRVINLNSNIEIRNLDIPEKKKISYHENTKGRNHEKDHETFRVFQISCFRDSFYFFAINANAQNKEIMFNSTAYCGTILGI